MKKYLLLIISFIISCSSSPEPTHRDKVFYDDGKYYLKENNQLFSGILFDTFENSESIQWEVPVKDGVNDGLLKQYYSSGRLEIEQGYKNGIKHQTYSTRYFDNEENTKKTVLYFYNDKAAGLFEEYHENGQLKIKTSVKDGRPHGDYDEYDENGELIKYGAYAGFFMEDLRTGPYSPEDEESESINSGSSKSASTKSGSQKGLYDLRNGEVVFRIVVTESNVDGIFNYDGFSSVYGVEGNVNGTIKNNTLYEDGVMRIGSIDSGGRWIKYEQWTIPKK